MTSRTDRPFNPLRRRLLATGLTGLAGLSGARQVSALPPPMVFPRDYGSHPDFRTEWWYITGYANAADPAGPREFGFQLTFFRSRVAATQDMKSAFAAKQLIFAHAALTDVRGKKLVHDQRIARSSGAAGFDLASASESDTAITLRDWSLVHEGRRYSATLPATGFGLDLQFSETQAVLLQGDRGLSRKGPQPAQVSHYYSQPQLAVRGTLRLDKRPFTIASGGAWLDHEWSDELLDPQATGWDWIGMNLDDGGALTAFRVRDKAGNALWDGGSYRSAAGDLRNFRRGEVTFSPQRRWKSPSTQTVYPVRWSVLTPTGAYTVGAVIDNQELDSRASTGAIYWEGLSDLFDGGGRRIGRGYLEMTGYAQPLRL
ncbi:carotenoid 1,2-hydratase [Polaromonas sp. C04]|uniref:lipocalin-like domain-containing protein n=1 Tax=Polaromonas sp. C04 TaxID=1945857 RepID=UPI00098464A8|nr:carotenoid 1,2-hydratase [Polaromonas sp. C04]OOG56061.1 carotenoid 1,2-hydratase [Polaromonas sp. C04]